MAHKLPPVPRLALVAKRLEAIFPEGVSHRIYCVRDVAARTVWVMLYASAIDGLSRWIRPSMVTDMTNRQASLLSDSDRIYWYQQSSSSTKKRPAKAWFAPNSREQIRDETIRLGLVPNGAVSERKGLSTTSPLPKYSLGADFAELFQEHFTSKELAAAIEQWRLKHLSKAALARALLIKKGTVRSSDTVLVTYPNGHTRSLAPGPSSVLSKATIEEFAPRYLKQPAVLWLSESASKVREQDNELTKSLGIKIDPAKELPDMILVDVGGSTGEILVVFTEIVATDGPITEQRKQALLSIAQAAGFDPRSIAFLSVFQDRSSSAFRKAIPDLALGSFTWFMAEPDSLMILRGGKPVPLSGLR
jgi:hypothetical protein